MEVGEYTYGAQNIKVRQWGEGKRLKIGKFCSIADNITVYMGGNHRTDWITTYPFGHVNLDEFTTFNGLGHPSTNGDVVIGNDVWIGSGATIMSGITIGDGAVVAANSHVVSNVEPYSVVGGNPSKHLRYRFSSAQITSLLRIAWWNWDVSTINSELTNLCHTDIQSFINKHDNRTLLDKYTVKCNELSDIYEHLPTLFRYGLECSHITECGVRSVTSSYAFASALQGKLENKLIQVDLNTNSNVLQFNNECTREGVNVVFYQESDLTCPMEDTELLFIDTWHIYGHLKRELSRWHSHVSKYIILHDTTVDEWDGETVRVGWDAIQQSIDTGIPVDEITKGLWPAVDEFLKEHPEWVLKERFTNNNGLTVLVRN